MTGVPSTDLYYELGLSVTTPNITGYRWLLQGEFHFDDVGASATYTIMRINWHSKDGANTATAPPLLTPVWGLSGSLFWPTSAVYVATLHAPDIIVEGGTTAYLVGYASMQTPANARLYGQIVGRMISY